MTKNGANRKRESESSKTMPECSVSSEVFQQTDHNRYLNVCVSVWRIYLKSTDTVVASAMLTQTILTRYLLVLFDDVAWLENTRTTAL